MKNLNGTHAESARNLSAMTDEELALAYINGNNQAFDLLLEHTKSGVFSYILCFVHDEDMANDLFQETYIKALMNLQRGTYATTGKFSNWMLRIAHNVVMDTYRKRRLCAVVDSGDNNDLSDISSEEMIDLSREALFVNEQILEDVKHIINFLPEKQRDIVYMRYFKNLSFKEIAQLTGTSINTALGRMRYAIMNMRKLAKENDIILSAQ